MLGVTMAVGSGAMEVIEDACTERQLPVRVERRRRPREKEVALRSVQRAFMSWRKHTVLGSSEQGYRSMSGLS